MRYLMAGTASDKPPLVLIHGLMGYAFSWRFNMEPLGEGRLVYALDLPGLGFSERCTDIDCGLQSTAERIMAFLVEQGITTFDLVGTSHGGGVAMKLAALASEENAPARLRRLVLVASINPWSRHGMLIAALLSTKIGGGTFRRVHPFFGTAHGLVLRRLYGDVKRITPGTLEGYAAPIKIKGTIEHALRIVATLRSEVKGLLNVIPKIAHLPTLIIWGDRDVAVLPNSAAKLAAQFKNAELVMMNGVGHLTYEEVPDEFNRVLIQFLDQP